MLTYFYFFVTASFGLLLHCCVWFSFVTVEQNDWLQRKKWLVFLSWDVEINLLLYSITNYILTIVLQYCTNVEHRHTVTVSFCKFWSHVFFVSCLMALVYDCFHMHSYTWCFVRHCGRMLLEHCQLILMLCNKVSITAHAVCWVLICHKLSLCFVEALVVQLCLKIIGVKPLVVVSGFSFHQCF